VNAPERSVGAAGAQLAGAQEKSSANGVTAGA
jgi:hypothetical protein